MSLTKIKSVDAHSPAQRAGVRPGETLTHINGRPIVDVLDYKFFAYDPRLELTLVGEDGRSRTLRVRKAEGEELGLNFETYLMDKARSCANRCIFCFVDQMPPGMRETLYFKDDDARRKHVVQEEERKADASKKYKCKDYVVIGDPANELKKISLDEIYKNFTGVLLLLNPTAEIKGGTGKHKVEGKEEAKAARNNMLKRYMDLLLPQK